MSTAPPRAAPLPTVEFDDGSRPTPLSLCGIVFDVPDVFYDATLWRRWLFQLLARVGSVTSYADFNRAWELQLVDVHRGRREYAEALQSLLLSHGLTWAQVDEIEAACRIKRQKLEADVRPLLGVVPVVEELNRRGIPLVAWADVPHTSAKLAQRLERLVPAARFAAVHTSFELEAVQPAEECYRAVVESLQCQPSEALYVGHDTEHLASAANAGLKTVAVNYDETARADFFLSRLEELISLTDGSRSLKDVKPAAPASGAALLQFATASHGGRQP